METQAWSVDCLTAVHPLYKLRSVVTLAGIVSILRRGRSFDVEQQAGFLHLLEIKLEADVPEQSSQLFMTAWKEATASTAMIERGW